MYDLFKVGEIVNFQAYEDHDKVKGKIKRIGTQSELGMMQLDPNDNRVFYELETVNETNNFVFTRTTINWITKI